ncbi:PilN domain-containing protein [Sulfurirhabdus autotrophica]|uniref:Tfp pilus assembly protein PilN n=1 Tax=Sulfurirhabdus autotrophica TaxID=1706046 RepID=A0A4R3YC16_9PROT|nr:PilN domain-containing protein [Sulfurirhabdus autotrophica]TCV89536.1 hypothetical protein EDC63_10254 [Sulfurirhabdus autotrophica]
MRKLDLNFQPKSRVPGMLGMLILIVTVLTGGSLYADYLEAKALSERTQASLVRLERLTGRTAEPHNNRKLSEQDSSEFKQAADVIDQLALPWGRLFGAVEDAGEQDVSLLSLQPDRKKGTLSIGAEAKNVKAMLEYMRRLIQEKPLQEVALLSHNIQEQDAEKPVRFTLSAKWIAE